MLFVRRPTHSLKPSFPARACRCRPLHILTIHTLLPFETGSCKDLNEASRKNWPQELRFLQEPIEVLVRNDFMNQPSAIIRSRFRSKKKIMGFSIHHYPIILRTAFYPSDDGIPNNFISSKMNPLSGGRIRQHLSMQ